MYDGTARIWDVGSGQLLQAWRQPAPSAAAAFSSDGSQLATGGIDTTVRIWDAATGQLRRPISGLTSSARSLVFSPDGRTLTGGCSDGSLLRWDVRTLPLP